MRGFVDEEEEAEVVVRVDARRGRRMVDDRVMVWGSVFLFGSFLKGSGLRLCGSIAVKQCTDCCRVSRIGRYQHLTSL